MKIQFRFFVFNSGGNLESFSKLKVIVRRHVTLQLVNYDKPQSNVFDSSIKMALNILLSSTAFFNLSIIKRR